MKNKENIKAFHSLLSRMDTKSSLLITIISVLMGTFHFIGLDKNVSVVFYAMSATALCLLLILISPWFAGRKTNHESNIWMYWKNKDPKVSEEYKFSRSLAILVGIKSIIFYLVILIIIATVISIGIMWAV